VNFFQPSFKLASKTRVGAKVHKTYHAPETPYAKLLALPSMSDEMKERLRAVALQLDPLRLLEEIRAVQHHLAALAAGEPTHLAPRHGGSLDGFLAGLATAWQHGEVRATHRLAPRAARDWRTRKDPFEQVWPTVRTWLEAEPDRIGKDLFARLQGELPGVFSEGQLRTFQRRSGSGDWLQRANSYSLRLHKMPRSKACHNGRSVVPLDQGIVVDHRAVISAGASAPSALTAPEIPSSLRRLLPMAGPKCWGLTHRVSTDVRTLVTFRFEATRAADLIVAAQPLTNTTRRPSGVKNGVRLTPGADTSFDSDDPFDRNRVDIPFLRILTKAHRVDQLPAVG